jgi:phage recombination protein Bet
MNKQLKTTTTFNREQVELIKQTVARGATDAELSLFLYTAQRTGLDPLTKQIHAIKRWDSSAGRETLAIQTGIDGYRLIADRTGKLAGIDDAEFDREDKTHPEKATVTVYKLINGEKCPFSASARWNEYCAFKKDGTPMALWKKMPYLMLGKCAEALALRKAFPADLTGIYTFEEEMAQDGSAPPLEVAAPIIKEASAATVPVKTTQPELLKKSASEPAKKPAKKVPTLEVKNDSPSSPQSNYTRLLEWLHTAGYNGADFMQVAHKNAWVPETVQNLKDVKDEHLAEFIKEDNLPLIAEQLDALKKEVMEI